jgi:protein disulfide-isomerase
VSVGIVLLLILAVASWFRGRISRSRGGHFRLDDPVGNLKDGLLGHQNGNTKAD